MGAQVPAELLDECEVGGVGVVGKAFEIEREAAIDRVGQEEAKDLGAKDGAVGWTFEEVADAGVPALGVGVEVVQVGEDLSVFL